MESSRNQYGFPVMNNEIIYVSRVFALKQKELVVISTSSFCFLKVNKVNAISIGESYIIRLKIFKRLCFNVHRGN